jgi:thiamine pyrophosphokinase
MQRKAAPPLSYYEELGSTGYRLAARYDEAEQHGIAELYRNCADFFPALRIALNRVADRHLFPATGDRIDRLLRQVADSFRQQTS